MSSIEVVRLVSRGPGRPSTSHRIFGFLVARARFFLVLSARHPVDSFITYSLIEPGVSKRESLFNGDADIGMKDKNHSIHLRAMVQAQEIMERLSNFYCKIDRAETSE